MDKWKGTVDKLVEDLPEQKASLMRTVLENQRAYLEHDDFQITEANILKLFKLIKKDLRKALVDEMVGLIK